MGAKVIDTPAEPALESDHVADELSRERESLADLVERAKLGQTGLRQEQAFSIAPQGTVAVMLGPLTGLPPCLISVRQPPFISGDPEAAQIKLGSGPYAGTVLSFAQAITDSGRLHLFAATGPNDAGATTETGFSVRRSVARLALTRVQVPFSWVDSQVTIEVPFHLTWTSLPAATTANAQGMAAMRIRVVLTAKIGSTVRSIRREFSRIEGVVGYDFRPVSSTWSGSLTLSLAAAPRAVVEVGLAAEAEAAIRSGSNLIAATRVVPVLGSSSDDRIAARSAIVHRC